MDTLRFMRNGSVHKLEDTICLEVPKEGVLQLKRVLEIGRIGYLLTQTLVASMIEQELGKLLVEWCTYRFQCTQAVTNRKSRQSILRFYTCHFLYQFPDLIFCLMFIC